MEFKKYTVKKDLIVVGGGMPGICAAIQAARLGLKVALVHNRGYLGGNASAEIRVNINGARNGISEFNFYSRETGIIEEIILENLYRNPEGNAYIWDSVLLDYILSEKNIALFLNTNIDKVALETNSIIKYVSGSQLGSEKRFEFYGKLFLDDTGDGTIGYLAGADFKMGRESQDEYKERIAPKEADESVLPSTLVFWAKDTGKPVNYIPPGFAEDLTKSDVLKYRSIPEKRFHMHQWYYELGGHLNQMENNEEITQQHRELLYGIWDYIKNSGKYNSETYGFEYVSSVPGKRESRRLMGDYILKENDILEQQDFKDTVGHGGWSVDLHSIGGFYSKEIINKHVFLKGVYQIPYRTGYSRNIENLFMAGRCMSASHVALGSTRVIATLSTLGQALGVAAYICNKYNIAPRGVYDSYIEELQQMLLKSGQYVIGVKNNDCHDKARHAQIEASSVKSCCVFKGDTDFDLKKDIGICLPIIEYLDHVQLSIKNIKSTRLDYEVYLSDKRENYSPDIKVKSGYIDLKASPDFRWVEIPINKKVDNGNVFLCLMDNQDVCIEMSHEKLHGVLCLQKNNNNAPNSVDIATLEMKPFIWRELDKIPCFQVTPQQDIYSAANINNGFSRPYRLPNIWVSDTLIDSEHIIIKFDEPETIREIILYFDSDLNFRIDNVLPYDYNQPYESNVIPEIIKEYTIYYKKDGRYQKLLDVTDNHQRVNDLTFDPINTDALKVVFTKTNASSYVGLYEVRVY